MSLVKELHDSESGDLNDDNTSSDSAASQTFPPSSSLKRILSNQTSYSEGGGDERDGKRRRFVWPEPLHKDFIAAIFDVGLRHASAETVLETMGKEDARCLSQEKISLRSIHATIAKFKLLRERGSRSYMSYYERSILMEGSQSLLQRVDSAPFGSSSSAMENDKLALNQKLYILQKQLEMVNNTVKIQSDFLNLVRSSMETQLKAQAELRRLILQLDASRHHHHPSAPHTNGSNGHVVVSRESLPPQGLEGGVPLAGQPVPTNRVELQIMSEMRAHMDLHRQLLLRKEDQVSQFNGNKLGNSSNSAALNLSLNHGSSSLHQGIDGVEGVPAPATAEDWNWDDELMVEHLFNFLVAQP